MKVITYTNLNGNLDICIPNIGARLASGYEHAGEVFEFSIRPIEAVFRRWPVDGVVPIWAETEDEFVSRIAAKDVPVTLTEPPEIIRQKILVASHAGTRLDSTPSMMLREYAERFCLLYAETPFRIIDDAAVPADRTFRESWKLGTLGVEQDMAKCREIHKTNLRRLRAPKLAALDIEYMRADEVGDTAKKANLAKQKQALRNVTADPAIASASTPEELKAVVPAVLVLT